MSIEATLCRLPVLGYSSKHFLFTYFQYWQFYGQNYLYVQFHSYSILLIKSLWNGNLDDFFARLSYKFSWDFAENLEKREVEPRCQEEWMRLMGSKNFPCFITLFLGWKELKLGKQMTPFNFIKNSPKWKWDVEQKTPTSWQVTNYTRSIFVQKVPYYLSLRYTVLEISQEH